MRRHVHHDSDSSAPRLRGSARNAVAVAVALVNYSSRGAAELGEDRARPRHHERLDADFKGLLLGLWMESFGAPRMPLYRDDRDSSTRYARSE